MNTKLVIIVLAASIVVNIITISYASRLCHWLAYWRKRYSDQIAPISPVPVKEDEEEKRHAYNWEEDWD